MRNATYALLAAAALVASAACTVDHTVAPSVSGPSEQATSLRLTASPDTVPQDGSTQSKIQVQAFDPAGKPLPNLAIRMSLNGSGSLSAASVVTGSDGKALNVFTAPLSNASATAVTSVQATPVGSDAVGSITFQVNIALTPIVAPGPPQAPPPPPTGLTPPTAAFTFSPAAPGVGDIIFFNASTSKAAAGHIITSYSWIYGDGGTATGVTPTHTYTASGSYGVQLTVTDDIGQSTTSAPTAVSVGTPPAPTANFTFSPTSPGRNDQVVFDASSSVTAQGQTITDVAWNFGDGTAVIHCPGDPSCITTNGTNRVSAHTFTLAQTFVVNLVVTDSAGRIGSHNTSVNVDKGEPNVVITTSPGSPNPGVTVQMNSNATTYFPGSGPASFAWTFGDGGTSTLANPSHAYGSVGAYSVGLSVTDNKGRTGVRTATVTVAPVAPPASPVAAFTFSPPSPALGGGASVTVNFDGSTSTTPSGAAIVTYRWNFGDGTIISGAPGGVAPAPGGTFLAPNHLYSTAGAKTVTLTVTDTNGLSGSTSSTVTIGP